MIASVMGFMTTVTAILSNLPNVASVGNEGMVEIPFTWKDRMINTTVEINIITIEIMITTHHLDQEVIILRIAHQGTGIVALMMLISISLILIIL